MTVLPNGWKIVANYAISCGTLIALIRLHAPDFITVSFVTGVMALSDWSKLGYKKPSDPTGTTKPPGTMPISQPVEYSPTRKATP